MMFIGRLSSINWGIRVFGFKNEETSDIPVVLAKLKKFVTITSGNRAVPLLGRLKKRHLKERDAAIELHPDHR
jgi:hypothetical protein